MAVAIQCRPAKHGHRRNHAIPEAGYGSMILLLDAPINGGITLRQTAAGKVQWRQGQLRITLERMRMAMEKRRGHAHQRAVENTKEKQCLLV